MPTPTVPPPVSRVPRDQLIGAAVVIAVLTVGAAAAGGRRWPLPERVVDGWLVAAVPPSLVALVAATTGVCLVAATVLTFRVTRLRPSEPAGLAWLGVVLLATAALGWYALLMAANGGWANFGPYIPVLDSGFIAVPALLAGRVTAARGAAVAAFSALGTAVATLPVYTLGIALLGSRDPFAAYLVQPLWGAFAFGCVPLLLAVVVSWNWGRTRQERAVSRR